MRARQGIVRNDLSIYEREAEGWWDPDDTTFASLRAINTHRLRWLRAALGASLATARVADLGCGGGLLSVPLAAGGARVVGVDLSRASLAAAAARGMPSACFVRADLRACPLAAGSFDLVLLADILEHLEDWPAAIASAARLLRRGGHLYVNTINRTWRARCLAVTLAEGLGYVPRGTHDPSLFVRPDALVAEAALCGFHSARLQGEAPATLRTLRTGAIHLRPSRSLAVAYAALFVKEDA